MQKKRLIVCEKINTKTTTTRALFTNQQSKLTMSDEFVSHVGKHLKELYDKYKDRGFVVIGVPSNNFGGQEPGDNIEIKEFCESKFAITFPLAEKVDVVGENTHPFYQWAAEVLGFGTKPKWNFHKYLVNTDGQLVDYFNSTTNPGSDRITQAIEKVLPAN